MKLTSEKIESVFYPSPTISSGLGIVETGWVAGGLSALFGVAFELLGAASTGQDSDEMVVKCSRMSRLLGEISQRLTKFIPVIPSVDRSEVLSFSGRLDSIAVSSLYSELGAVGAVVFVDAFLCAFIESATDHYLSRCGNLSDKSFSRVLTQGKEAVTEVRDVLDSHGLEWVGNLGKDPVNLRNFEEILDLSWPE